MLVNTEKNLFSKVGGNENELAKQIGAFNGCLASAVGTMAPFLNKRSLSKHCQRRNTTAEVMKFVIPHSLFRAPSPYTDSSFLVAETRLYKWLFGWSVDQSQRRFSGISTVSVSMYEHV